MTYPYTKAYFEEGKGSHYHGYEDWDQFKQRAEWIKRTYDPKSVLELGCAKGFLVKHLRDLGVTANGLDISEYAISKSPVKQYLKVVDITEQPIDVSAYSLVVSFDFLEHIKEEDLFHVLETLKSAPEQFHMITTLDYHFGGEDTHYTMRYKDWWVKKFEEAGIRNFDIIHSGEHK